MAEFQKTTLQRWVFLQCLYRASCLATSKKKWNVRKNSGFFYASVNCSIVFPRIAAQICQRDVIKCSCDLRHLIILNIQREKELKGINFREKNTLQSWGKQLLCGHKQMAKIMNNMVIKSQIVTGNYGKDRITQIDNDNINYLELFIIHKFILKNLTCPQHN